MKTILATLLLIGATTTLAQTSVIAVKSHHGDLSEIPESTDHFGEFRPMPVYDTIVKINNGCVIQIGKDNGFGMPFKDTVCDHWYYEKVRYDIDKVQEYHGKDVILVGFSKEESNLRIKNNPFFGGMRKSGFPLWALIPITLIGLGLYIFKPKLTWKK